jgi:hypothetical protein
LLLDIQSRRISLFFFPLFPPHNRDGDIVPMISRMRSGNAQHPPQLEIIRPTQRVPDQMGTRVVVDEGPCAFCEFAAFGFSLDGRGAYGRGNEFGEVGFGY